jgi:NAD(P)-dependent dehydrogenase (short-subunit alcohol dehydrogenase family)
MEKHAHEPIPGALFGVGTEHMDETTWDWLSRMQAPSRKPLFEGQVFLITGGASGVGEKLCVISALLGAKVFTFDVSEEICTKFEKDRITGIACDIGDYEKARKITKEIGDEHGITKVILNAGIFPNPRPVDGRFDMKGFEQVMRINAFGNIAVCDAALAYLWSKSNINRDPLIAIVGSRNLSIPSHASYTVSKAALAQYGCYLAHLASPQGCPQHRVYWEHPDAVFDTKVWGKTAEERRSALEASAAKKGMTLDEYLDKSNPMKVSFTSWIVAGSIIEMALPTNRGKHGVGLHHNGGVYISRPW